MSDDFDVFGSAPPPTATSNNDPFALFDIPDCAPAPPLLPRASAHPHFAACSNLWPHGVPATSDEQKAFLTASDEQLGSFAAARAEAVAKGLRKSRSQYGRACASSLLAAVEAFGRGASSELGGHARACSGLCSTAIEESNWDSPAWQEANLLALCYQLSLLLRDADAAVAGYKASAADDDKQLGADGDASRGTADAVGVTAISLFNLAVATASPMAEAPTWLTCVSLLLQRAEAAVGAARPPRLSVESAGAAEAAALWRIPTELPPHNVPQ